MSYIEFETSFLRNIKNNVYISIYCRIIDMLDQAKFKHEHLNDTIGLMKRHNITRDLLRGRMKHEDTPEIQNMHKQRRQMLASLRDVVDRLSKMPGFATDRNAKILQHWMKEYRELIGSRNVQDELYVAYQMELDLDYTYHIKESLEETYLLKLMNSIVEINHEIMNLELNRYEYNAAKTLKYERKIRSYDDLNLVLPVLKSVAAVGKQDAELAAFVAENIQKLLRRERGYLKMVDTKKRQKEEQGEKDQDLGE